MTKFGKREKDGTIIEATECAVSGWAVSPKDGSVREWIAGTGIFYRVHGSQYHRMTDEIRANLAREAGQQEKTSYSAPVKVSKSSEVKENG